MFSNNWRENSLSCLDVLGAFPTNRFFHPSFGESPKFASPERGVRRVSLRIDSRSSCTGDRPLSSWTPKMTGLMPRMDTRHGMLVRTFQDAIVFRGGCHPINQVNFIYPALTLPIMRVPSSCRVDFRSAKHKFFLVLMCRG